MKRFVDLHFHAGADSVVRKYSVEQAAHEAADSQGWLVIKSHAHETVTVARHFRRYGLPVSGSVVLNTPLAGGLREHVTALAAANREFGGCRLVVYLPTRRLSELADDYFDENSLSKLGHELVEAVIDSDCVLGTGHLPGEQIRTLATAYASHGGERLLLTHATHPMGSLTASDIEHLIRVQGVWAEITALTYVLERAQPHTLTALSRSSDRLVLSSDFGQPEMSGPRHWLAVASTLATSAGLSSETERIMTYRNPAELIGICL